VHARRREAAARYRIAVQELGKHLNGAHQHGCHAWLHLPPSWPTPGFVSEARRRGVAVSPSEAFAVDPTFVIPAVRVCFGPAANTAELTTGVRVLAEMLDGSPDVSTALL
jgi:DNA-binding transcriptional MocR family regulator